MGVVFLPVLDCDPAYSCAAQLDGIEEAGAPVAALCGWRELSPAGHFALALEMSEVGLSTSGFRLGGLLTC